MKFIHCKEMRGASSFLLAGHVHHVMSFDVSFPEDSSDQVEIDETLTNDIDEYYRYVNPLGNHIEEIVKNMRPIDKSSDGCAFQTTESFEKETTERVNQEWHPQVRQKKSSLHNNIARVLRNWHLI